ncbi:hypothetical protein SBDP1_50034 [Syntrophobacter sp. SbD1]|nr:hypothetical protein SBDP1_50034 [Syntrophobacter sp. SbD1]
MPPVFRRELVGKVKNLGGLPVAHPTVKTGELAVTRWRVLGNARFVALADAFDQKVLPSFEDGNPFGKLKRPYLEAAVFPADDLKKGGLSVDLPRLGVADLSALHPDEAFATRRNDADGLVRTG